MIRALLYRLLIISAHLQRHGIRLLIAIGRFNARAARSLPQPFSPATFLIANHPRSLPLLFLPLLFPLSLPPPNRRFSARGGPRIDVPRSETHYNYLGPRPRGHNAENGLCRNFATTLEKGWWWNGKNEISRKSSSWPRAKIGGGSADSRNESEIAARLIKSELHSTGVYTPTAVRWGSTSITVVHHR